MRRTINTGAARFSAPSGFSRQRKKMDAAGQLAGAASRAGSSSDIIHKDQSSGWARGLTSRDGAPLEFAFELPVRQRHQAEAE
jgi:hypothetical protein